METARQILSHPVTFVSLAGAVLALLLWTAAKLDALGQRRPILATVSTGTVALVWAGFALYHLRHIPHLRSDNAPPILFWESAFYLIALWLAIPAVRRFVMPKLGLDPRRVVHNLVLYGGYFSFLLLLLLKLSGAAVSLGFDNPSALNSMMLGVLALQSFLFAIFALLGVGWLSYRTTREVAQRCGLRRSSWGEGTRQVGIGLAANFALLTCLGGVLLLLQDTVDFPLDANEIQIGDVPFTLHGLLFLLVITIGPGIGEELLLRGALQPRIGIFWTSLLFTSIHPQYPLAGLITVFFMSVVFGIVAKRYGLWVSIAMHALHNLFAGTQKTISTYLETAGYSQYETIGKGIAGVILLTGLVICCVAVYQWCCKHPVPSQRIRYGRYALLAVWSTFLITGALGLSPFTTKEPPTKPAHSPQTELEPPPAVPVEENPQAPAEVEPAPLENPATP